MRLRDVMTWYELPAVAAAAWAMFCRDCGIFACLGIAMVLMLGLRAVTRAIAAGRWLAVGLLAAGIACGMLGVGAAAGRW